MHGASISRWTMAYFAAALAFLVTALALMALGFGLPTTAVDAPDTLAIVHLVAIGWLGLLFGGALLQFVPVLAATHLRLPWMAAPALGFLIIGLVFLVTGFLGLRGDLAIDLSIMSAGGLLLGGGFTLLAMPLVATLASQRKIGLPGIMVALGLGALAAAAMTGNLFAGLLSGVLDIPSLGSRIPELAGFHGALGALGWMTITAIGVSYKLFAMFMLAPERPEGAIAVIVFAAVAVTATVLAMTLVAGGSAYATLTVVVAMLSATALLAVYISDVQKMFMARRRRALELNSIAGLSALAYLAAALLLLVSDEALQADLRLGPAAFYLVGMGWLSGLGLAQLYKIIPFLTWLETYGPVMGKSEVPRVQDLVRESRARPWFGIYNSGVLMGAAGVALGSSTTLQAASCVECAAVLALCLEFLQARNLAYAPPEMRLPPGASRPHLIYAITISKE